MSADDFDVSMLRQELTLTSPWMNAAGMLGFTPPNHWAMPAAAGAFITDPISLAARAPAVSRAVLPYPGGFLLHSGFPNPGLRAVLKQYAARWAQSELPIWVHLMGQNAAEIEQMVRRLEGMEGVMAVEISLPPEMPGNEALNVLQAAYGELPVVVNVPITEAGQSWLGKLAKRGMAAISLSAPRGTVYTDTGRPVSGRLFGPSLLPLTLAAVQSARRWGLPLIAGAGVYSAQDAQQLRDAGAWAVQVDSLLWRNG